MRNGIKYKQKDIKYIKKRTSNSNEKGHYLETPCTPPYIINYSKVKTRQKKQQNNTEKTTNNHKNTNKSINTQKSSNKRALSTDQITTFK